MAGIKIDSRQIKNRAALSGLGTSADATLDTILPAISSSAQASIDNVMTGFQAWGSGSNYWTIGSGKFYVGYSGTVYVKGKLVSFTANQYVTPVANKTAYVGIDSTGALIKVDHDTITASDFENYAFLFEVWFDGTNYIVVKENHPAKFSVSVSGFLHNNIGTVIRGTGANIARVTTGTGSLLTDRYLKISGADFLEDHGLSTVVEDSSGSGVNINFVYKNASGKWILYASQTNVPMVYNNAGVVTALGTGPSNDNSIMTIYVSKDNINSSSPTYFAIIDAAVYSTVAKAQAALSAGTFAVKDNELSSIELCQLGHIILENNASGGYINTVIISKSTANSKVVGGGVNNNSHLTLADLSGGQYSDGGHSNLMTFKSSSALPGVSDDGSAYKVGARWYCTTDGYTYQLVDATLGAAIWQKEGIKAATAMAIIFG